MALSCCYSRLPTENTAAGLQPSCGRVGREAGWQLPVSDIEQNKTECSNQRQQIRKLSTHTPDSLRRRLNAQFTLQATKFSGEGQELLTLGVRGINHYMMFFSLYITICV